MIEDLASIGARHVFGPFHVEDFVGFAIIALIVGILFSRRKRKFKKDIAGFKDKARVSESFEQIYQRLSEKHRPQLDAMRKPIVRKLLLAGGIFAAAAILLIVLAPQLAAGLLSAILALGIVAFCFWLDRLKRPYVLYFRETVAKDFVALVDSKLSYSSEPSDRQWERIMDQYHIPQFEGSIFDSPMAQMVPVESRGSPGLSNFIRGTIEGRPFELCCMYLGSHTDKLSSFKGLFVSIRVSKRLQGHIKVERKVRRGMKAFRPRFTPNRELRKMDSPAFERDFRVASNDQVTAMRYLTADVMELLLNHKNELLYLQTRFNRNILPRNPNRIKVDFFWQGNEVLMRIGSKKMFKPTLRDPMCKDSLACCLATLTFATKLNHVITKSIKETAI